MNRAEYKRRRRRLAKAMGADALAILPAATPTLRNQDVEHPFRQHSDFSYLCGFPEPDAWMVLAPKRAEGEWILFCRPRDPERERWEGARFGVEGAVSAFDANEAFPLEALDEQMPKLIEGRERLYFPIGANPAVDARILGWVNAVRAKVRTGARAPDVFVRIESLLHEQRLIKSASELKAMRRAAEISVQAHCHLMRVCAPGLHEYDLDAEFRHACARAGARELAYPSVVGAASNACVLHYRDNDAALRDGDLVLIDAGCEFAGYASDITRTFPVNGRFTEPQRALYDLVLEAQRAAIAKARPGLRWNDPHDAAVRVLTRGLIRLGVLSGRVGRLIKDEAYKPYYMHRTGHWLGMDVHDVGHYKVDGEWRPLEPGMVLTIEPGLYMPDSNEVPKALRNIGIRIEDDVLITEDGCEILSAGAPKDPTAIETLMRASRIGGLGAAVPDDRAA